MTKMELSEVLKIWADNGIVEAKTQYSCGGDSMGDMVTFFYTENGEINLGNIQDEVSDFHENEMFKEVEFYVNSDGYYMGESGSVITSLNDERDNFDYEKVDAEYEYSESLNETHYIQLSNEEIEVLTKFVHSISCLDGAFNVEYLGDAILSDKDIQIIDTLKTNLDFEIENWFDNQNVDFVEVNEYFWGTFEDSWEGGSDEPLKIIDGKIELFSIHRGYAYRDK